MDGVVHPDILIEFFPTQGTSLQTQFEFFKEGLRGISEQLVFRRGETHEPLVGQLQPNPPALNPATQGLGRWWRVIVHGHQYRRE